FMHSYYKLINRFLHGAIDIRALRSTLVWCYDPLRRVRLRNYATFFLFVKKEQKCVTNSQ
ncbi:MAG: hypothetical protein WCP07_11945, partial [bacterium]